MNILAKLYAKLLLKLEVMKTFLLVIRSLPFYLEGLNLQSIEVESLAQVIHYLTLLYAVETLTKLLLKTIIEYH